MTRHDGSVKISAMYQGASISEFIPGQPINIDVTGLPKGALMAVRSSNMLGWFTNMSKDVTHNPGKAGADCVSQMVNPDTAAPTAELPTVSGLWTAPCGSKQASVTFTVVWSNGSHTQGKPLNTYVNLTSITVNRNTNFDCFQSLDKVHCAAILRPSLRPCTCVFTHRMPYLAAETCHLSIHKQLPCRTTKDNKAAPKFLLSLRRTCPHAPYPAYVCVCVCVCV